MTHFTTGSFFAVRAGAAHWDASVEHYAPALGWTEALVPHDRFAVNHAIHGDGLGRPDVDATVLLDFGCNWICDREVPMWNDDAGAFCKPCPPSEPLGTVHLAHPAKRTVYNVRRTGGSSFPTSILSTAAPDQPIPNASLAGANLRAA